MNRMLLASLILGLLSGCDGDDNGNADANIDEIISLDEGVYSNEDGLSFFFSKKELFSFLYRPIEKSNDIYLSASHRLVTLKPNYHDYTITSQELTYRDLGVLSKFITANININVSSSNVNVKLIEGVNADDINVLYRNLEFSKVLNDNFISLKDGVYNSSLNDNVIISDNTKKVSITYDEYIGLTCKVSGDLNKENFYYKISDGKIDCSITDDNSNIDLDSIKVQVEGDYFGVIYESNRKAIVALSKDDMSNLYRASFSLYP